MNRNRLLFMLPVIFAVILVSFGCSKESGSESSNEPSSSDGKVVVDTDNPHEKQSNSSTLNQQVLYPLQNNAGKLQREFNRVKNKKRFLMILSPT